jgi:hypothetical protein
VATLQRRYAAQLAIGRKVLGVVPNCHAYLEIWRVGLRSYNLTDREREVLELAAQGHSNTTIAARLHLSQKTIRNNDPVPGVCACHTLALAPGLRWGSEEEQVELVRLAR